MRRYPLILLAFLCSSTAWADGDRLRVFVSDYVVDPAVPVAQGTANQILTARTARLGFFDFVSKDEVRQLVDYESMRQQLGLDDEGTFLLELGQQIDADRVIAGRIGLVGETFVLGLTLFDVRRSQVEKRWSRTVKSDVGPDLLINGLNALADSLLVYLLRSYRPDTVAAADQRIDLHRQQTLATRRRQAAALGWGLSAGAGAATALTQLTTDAPPATLAAGYGLTAAGLLAGSLLWLLAPELPGAHQLAWRIGPSPSGRGAGVRVRW